MKRMHTDREIRSMAVDSVEQKSNLKVFENIVDKDGHKRFIEGEIAIATITGVTQTYGKWSLSGTHLMLVLCVNIAEGTAISFTILSEITLPEWIFNKLTPLYTDVVSQITCTAYGADATAVTSSAFLTKRTSPKVGIIFSGLETTDKERNMRLQFDFLIDNE